MKYEKVVISRHFIQAFFFLMILCQGFFINNLWAVDDKAAGLSSLTSDEILWLNQHPVIRIAPDPSFQPIEFFDKNGKYSGIGADYAALIAQKLGITFEVVRCKTWDDVIAKIKRREVDVLNAVVRTPQRETYLDFTSPYLKIPSVIIVRKSVVRELTLEMLKGMKIAMVSGYGYVDLIRNNHPKIDISLVPELQTALQKVSFGMVDAFVGDLATASFYIEQLGITNLKLAGHTQPPNISGFAVRSDWPELTQILEKGIALITDKEQNNIQSKWIHLGQTPGITKQEFKNWMIGGLSAIALISCGFLVWNRRLNTKLFLKTKDLSKEIDERKLIEDTLKEQTAFLDKIIETSAISMWISDENGTAIRTNPACLKFFGASSDEVVGKYNLFKDSVLQANGLMPEIKTVFKKGKTASLFVDYDFGAVDHVKVKNATHKVINSILTPVIDDGGNVTNVIVQAIDLSEIKQAQVELMQAQQHAASQEKHALVGQIAGQIAHDFNNILGAIMGNTELAMIDCHDENLNRTLELIFAQTLRGKKLTKNLVSFAKDQEPKQIFFKINEKIDLVKTLLKKDLNGIEVIQKNQPGIPDLLADPGMIEHALVNLVQNAIHAVSKSVEPKIIFQTYTQNNEIFIEIEDNGCGIPQEYLEAIYEPSFSLKGSRDISGSYEKNIKGTGYGMANVRKIIKQHKGNILVESKIGAGTKFIIRLPVIQKTLTEKEKIELEKEMSSPERYILLVEDEIAISDVQYRVLTQEPCCHKVDIANNGQVAMDLFDRNRYDLVSLDYSLPGQINGMDLYHHIRKTDKKIPILFISGNIEFIESISALRQQDPFIGHLSKPCFNKDYVKWVNRLICQNNSAEVS